MTTFGDPGYHYHSAMGQYLTLLAYHLANDELIPYDLPVYTTALRSYYDDLLSTINSTGQALDITELAAAITQFETSANQAMALMHQAVSTNDAALKSVVNQSRSFSSIFFLSYTLMRVREYLTGATNSKNIFSIVYAYLGRAMLTSKSRTELRDFQRGFTSAGGLPDREFYRHVVNAPGIDTGYAPTTFPGITEAVEAGNFSRAAEWVGRTSLGIRRAADVLKN